MKVLIAGAAGQLGKELSLACQAKGWETIACTSQEFDITKPLQIKDCLHTHQPDYVVNCAAYTKVDLAEDEPEQAFAVNATGVKYLAESCRYFGIPLIHISTDYVFDGDKQGSYLETDLPNPQNVYGKSKWAGEELLRSSWDKHIILRVSWVCGRFGHNFVTTMLKLKDKSILKIVDDQYGAPTGAAQIAECIIHLLGHPDLHQYFGTYHYTDGPATTWFKFAGSIFKKAQQQGLMSHAPQRVAVSTAEYGAKAKRPLNSRMDCSKIKQTFGVEQGRWDDELDLIFDYLSEDL